MVVGVLVLRRMVSKLERLSSILTKLARRWVWPLLKRVGCHGAGSSQEASLMVSPVLQSLAVEGEANVGRYLARLLPAALPYETPNDPGKLKKYVRGYDCITWRHLFFMVE